MNYSKIYDISWPLTNKTASYPGNPEIKIESFVAGTSQISKLELGSHTGTHFDAPSHVDPQAAGMDKYPLEMFIGPARVIDCTDSTESITLDQVKNAGIKSNERVLFKTTNSNLDQNTFHDVYVFLHGDAAEYLASIEVQLVGVDYLSIKQRGSKDNRPHTALLDKQIPIIEGLDLSQVEAGEYTLVALPLSLGNLDGAPGRAVLLE